MTEYVGPVDQGHSRLHHQLRAHTNESINCIGLQRDAVSTVTTETCIYTEQAGIRYAVYWTAIMMSSKYGMNRTINMYKKSMAERH